MDLTDKLNELVDKMKAKNYLYNAVQTVINKAVATSPASPVLAGPLFSELIIFIKIAFI